MILKIILTNLNKHFKLKTMANLDLSIKLYDALKLSGYKYLKHITLDETDEKELINLSPKAMVDFISAKYDLGLKNKIFNICQEVYKLNQKNVFKYKMTDSIKFKGFDIAIFLYILRNEQLPLTMVGENNHCDYHFIGDKEPQIEDADIVYNMYAKYKDYRLTDEIKSIIKENISNEDKMIKETDFENQDFLHKYKIKDYFATVNNLSRYKAKKKGKRIITETIIDRKKINDIKNDEELTIDKLLKLSVNKSIHNGIINQQAEISNKKYNKKEGLLFLINKKVELYQQMLVSLQNYNNDIENYLINKLEE